VVVRGIGAAPCSLTSALWHLERGGCEEVGQALLPLLLRSAAVQLLGVWRLLLLWLLPGLQAVAACCGAG
jgi:hypothetical protein